MGESSYFNERPNVSNDVSGTVHGPVGQFGTVHGNVSMNWSATTDDPDVLAQAIGRLAATDDSSAANEIHDGQWTEAQEQAHAASVAFRTCLVLAVASFVTFGLLTQRWVVPGVLSLVGAVLLYRAIAPSDSFEEDDDPAGESWVTHETWEESWEEHWEWEYWEEG